MRTSDRRQNWAAAAQRARKLGAHARAHALTLETIIDCDRHHHTCADTIDRANRVRWGRVVTRSPRPQLILRPLMRTMISSKLVLLCVAFGAAVVACSSTSPSSAFKDVASTVEARGGSGHLRLRWDQNTQEDEEARKAIDKLLATELSADAAVQVALLASPRLRGWLEELSIAQADLVQAGLLKNPVFTFGRTAWDGEHLDVNLFAAVEQDFLDILTLPLRKRVAATQLEATKLEVGDMVLSLAAEVRSAFLTAQAAAQVVAMRRLVDEAAQASADLAKEQLKAGNASELAVTNELGLAAQTALDVQRAEGEAAVEREHLTKLLGVWGPRTKSLRLQPRLPDLPAREVEIEKLESLAIAQRLDIAAGRREVQTLDYAISLARWTRWTGTVTVGVEAGRLRDSKRIAFGPSVSVEVPLFDQRQAAIARLEAIKRQREDNLQALAIDVRSDVRVARLRVLTARNIVERFANTIVPLRERLVKLSQLEYDAMLIGVYQLVQVKQAEFSAYREYIEALRDYWIARSDLERAIGGRPRGEGTAPAGSAPPQQPPAATSPNANGGGGGGHDQHTK